MHDVPHTDLVDSAATAPLASGAYASSHSRGAAESTITLEQQLALNLALVAVERAQLEHERPVTSSEVLALLTPDEFEALGRTSRKLARELKRRTELPDPLGRVLRRSRVNGHARWRVALVAPAPTRQLRALSVAITAELRRADAF